MAFYTGDLFPEWQGDLFVGALKMRKLVRLEIRNGDVTEEEDLLTDPGERILDVRMVPDGALWLLTDPSRGKVYRTVRANWLSVRVVGPVGLFVLGKVVSNSEPVGFRTDIDMLGRAFAQGFVDHAYPQAKNTGDGVYPAVQLAATAAAEGAVLAGTGLIFSYPVFTGEHPEPHRLHRRAGREGTAMGAPTLAAMAQGNRSEGAVIFKGEVATQALAGIHGSLSRFGLIGISGGIIPASHLKNHPGDIISVGTETEQEDRHHVI